MACCRRLRAIRSMRILRWRGWWMWRRRRGSRGSTSTAKWGKRIMAALEFQAQYLPPNNAPAPEHLEFALRPTWEIAYNEFHDRLGMKLPKMAAVLPTIRPTGINHQIAWETLTHGSMGSVGLPPLKAAEGAGKLHK